MTSGLKTKLDYGDLAHIPADRLRYELAEGDLHVTPAPSPLHQWVGKVLQRQLEDHFETRGIGRVFNAPIDVILTPHDVFQPDLVVVTDLALITSRAIEGPPTLVVEVLSESTSQYDRITKARHYAALGIEHYWIVDIDAKALECYRRRGDTYETVTRLSGSVQYRHPDLPGLTLQTGPLWTQP
jgi:Uma2 family endonuclease